MLRTEQKAAIRQGFEMGFSDTRIARVLKIQHLDSAHLQGYVYLPNCQDV